MASTPAAPAKVSWLKKIGQIIGKILTVIGKDAAPVADEAAKVAEVMIPQFAPEIAAADGLVTKFAKEAVAVEAVGAAASTAPTGAAKLEAVVTAAGPALDQWVANAFPGAGQVSLANKSGFAQAVFNIINDIQPTATAPDTATT